MKADDEENICEVKSLGSGELKRQPSWGDINTLIGRIEALEQEREDERIGLVNPIDDVNADIDDFKDNNVTSTNAPTLRRRASPRRGTLARMLMRSQSDKSAFDEEIEEVEQKYDHFELPESTYTFLLAEPILSVPFGMGCVTYAIVRQNIAYTFILWITTHLEKSFASLFFIACTSPIISVSSALHVLFSH